MTLFSLLAQSVLIFVLDDVAAVDISAYGGPAQTPFLEALAASGCRFTRAYASPTCAPSRRSLQFGHWWVSGSGESCSDGLDPDTPTFTTPSIAESLPLHASAVFGKWHLGVGPTGLRYCSPVERGYTYWVQGMQANVGNCSGTNYTSWQRQTAASPTQNCTEGISTVYEPRAMRDAFLTQYPTAPRPALTVFSCNLAHLPLHAPPPDMLPPGYPTPLGSRDRYNAMIAAYDRVIGAMLALVDLQDTIVIVVGDNGTPPVVAPVPRRAKGSTLERGVRVPLIVAGGPIVAGVVNDELVHIVDLWATSIEAGGRAPPNSTPWTISSVSLMPLLTGQPHSDPHDFVLIGSGWGLPDGDVAAVSRPGLFGSSMKLRQLDIDGDRAPDVEELYDVDADPDEQVNLIGLRPFEESVMRAWMANEIIP